LFFFFFLIKKKKIATRPTQLERVRTNVESMFGITTEAQKRNIKYYQSKSFFQRTDQPQMQSKVDFIYLFTNLYSK